MKKTSLVLLALVASTATVSESAFATDPPTLQQAQNLQLQAEIPLACSGATASDVRSENHSIKNTLHTTIPKGYVLHWRASNGKSGSVALTADLPMGQSVDVSAPGSTNGYTCTAGFYAGNPDLAVKSVKWVSSTSAQVEIENLNNFTGAGASVVKVESFKCVSIPVQNVSIAVPALDKGASTTVTVTIPQSNADYLQATANSTGSVPETNKSNNVTKSLDFQKNKTCSPG